MTLITLQDGKIVVRDGKVGTEQACCCGCLECPDECCVLISGRNTCESGDAGELPPDGEYEAWGVGNDPGDVLWGKIVPADCDVGPFPGLVYSIGITILACNPATGVTPVRVNSYTDQRCPPGVPGPTFGVRWHFWDGVLVTDENGCPTGIVLDQSTKVTKYGTFGDFDDLSDDPADGDSGVEPLNPEDYITFECNPLP
jgi:hypothetical protein